MSINYDNPMRITYYFGLHDFAAGNLASAISIPNGVEMGRIEEMHVSVTEVFNEVSSAAFLRIGTAGDADHYAELDMGAAAATNGYGIADDATPADVLKDIGHGGKGVFHIAQENIGQLEVTTLQNTGGTPTGIGHLSITVAWW